MDTFAFGLAVEAIIEILESRILRPSRGKAKGGQGRGGGGDRGVEDKANGGGFIRCPPKPLSPRSPLKTTRTLAPISVPQQQHAGTQRPPPPPGDEAGEHEPAALKEAPGALSPRRLSLGSKTARLPALLGRRSTCTSMFVTRIRDDYYADPTSKSLDFGWGGGGGGGGENGEGGVCSAKSRWCKCGTIGCPQNMAHTL